MNPLLHILFAIVAGALCGALWAGIAGFLKATVGAHEVISTIMLNWIAIWIGVFLFGLGGPLQNDTQEFVPISNDVVEGAKLPVFWGDPLLPGPPRRLLHRDRRARRLLAHPQPDDARLRRQGRRLQPRGGALRRHQRLPQLLPRDGDLRRVRRASRAQSTSSAGSSGSRPATSRRVQIAFVGIAVALLGRNTAVGVAPLGAPLRRARSPARRRATSIPRSSSPSSPRT